MMQVIASAFLRLGHITGKRFALIATCFFCFSAGLAEPLNAGSYPPEVHSANDQKVILKVGDVTLTTLRTPTRYMLLLGNSAGQHSKIVMPDTPWNVAGAAQAIGGKVVVDLPAKDGGGPQFGDNTIFILGSKPPVLLDQFRCESPLLSPNGKMLSFIAFYPPHLAPDSLTSDFVMLYDLEKTVMENRNAPRTDFPMNNISDRRVGLQVYPLSRHSGARSSVSNGDAEPMHSIYGLTWSRDASKLIFWDETEYVMSDVAQSTQTGDLGNLRDFSKIAGEPERFLVMIDIMKSGPVARRISINPCPVISGNRCIIDLHTAIFGRDELIIMQQIKGQTNKDANIHVSYSSFQVVH